MLDQVSGDIGHIYRFPCKNTYIVPQEPDERIFLFRIQSGYDESHLLGVVIDQLDLFVLLGFDVFLGAYSSGILSWSEDVCTA
jgi:hypothetical protein